MATGWRLALRMAHSEQSRLQEPRGVVRFDLKTDDGVDEAVDVEFTHEQLSEFFHQLQTMQAQLDALRAT